MLHTTNYQAFEILSHGHIAHETVLHTFSGAERAGRALPGDFVEWDASAEKCALVNRTIHPPLTGLLDISSKTLYGMTSRHVPIFLFYPYDKRYPPMRVGCSAIDRSTNLLVTVRFEDWPQGETWPRANLETVIGPVGDYLSEGTALVASASPFWRKKVNYTDPRPDLTAHKELPADDGPAPWFIFHIDPAGCRDVDDIIGIQRRHDGRINLLIGISDVAAYIASGSELDRIAYHNSSTVYSLNGTALRPMLPSALSEGVLSLLPGSADPKAVVGLTCIYDGNKFTDIAFGNYLVHVNRTYSYESIMAAAAAEKAGGLPPATQPVTDSEICDTLADAACSIARRVAGTDTVIDVAANTRDSHPWLEQLMIFYNLEAAAMLAAGGRGIFRESSGSAPEKLDALRLLPEDLHWIAARPATYTSETGSLHLQFGNLYCHATSPIRRYVDLCNQRALKEILATPADVELAPTPAPAKLITHLNLRQRQIRAYQRHLTFLTAILQSNEKTVDATVVEIGETKARLYIHQWKTVVNTIEYAGLAIGTKLRLQFYYNPNRPNWKERIVFEITN